MKTVPYAIAGLLALASTGCNSSTDSSAGATGLSAKFQGKAWEANAVGVYANALATVPGCYIFGGTQTDGTNSQSITVTLYNIGGPGTYKLGTGSNVHGGMGQAGEGTGGGNSNSWITDGTGLDGEITLTEIGKGRIKGTFRFTAVPGRNNTLAVNREITEGKVDLAYQGTPLAVQDKHGGTVTAMLNGKPYNAATIHSASLKDINGNAGVNITTTTSLNGISLLVAGAAAPGKFPIIHKQPNPVSILTGKNGTDPETCCWGGGGDDKDSAFVEITSLTATRIKGKFYGKIMASPGKPSTVPMIITDGTFDVGVTD